MLTFFHGRICTIIEIFAKLQSKEITYDGNCDKFCTPIVSFVLFNSPLDDPCKNKIRCTPRGTKVAIYHIVGNLMLNSMHNVVSLVTCAESL